MWLFVLSAVYFASTCVRAAHERFWFDELETLDATSLSPPALWSFLKRGLDINPPLGYLIFSASANLFGRNELGLRFPSIIAFWLMMLSLFVFLRRRLSWQFAIAGMLLVALTAAVRFSYEARAYALMLAFAGFALVAWQLAAEGRMRRLALPGIAASLAAALGSHGMAVTLAIPFLAGEVTRSIQRRRVDVPVWCSFATALPMVWILWSLKSSAGSTGSIRNLFHPLQMAVLTYFLILLPMILPLSAALFLVLMARSPSGAPPPQARIPRYELAALIGFVLIPFVAILLSPFAGSSLPRYSMNSVIGLAACAAVVLSGIAASRSEEVATAIALLLSIFFVVDQLLPTSTRLSTPIEYQATPLVAQRALEGMIGERLPIVIGSPLTFVEFEHYGSPQLAARLWYLTDPQFAAGTFACLDGSPCWPGGPRFDLNGPVLEEFFPFRSHFAKFTSFVLERRRFIATEPGWVVPRLAMEGAQVRLKGAVEGLRYYEVVLK